MTSTDAKSEKVHSATNRLVVISGMSGRPVLPVGRALYDFSRAPAVRERV